MAAAKSERGWSRRDGAWCAPAAPLATCAFICHFVNSALNARSVLQAPSVCAPPPFLAQFSLPLILLEALISPPSHWSQALSLFHFHFTIIKIPLKKNRSKNSRPQAFYYNIIVISYGIYALITLIKTGGVHGGWGVWEIGRV